MHVVWQCSRGTMFDCKMVGLGVFRWRTSSCQVCLHVAPCSHLEQHARVMKQCSWAVPEARCQQYACVLSRSSFGAWQHTCLRLTCGLVGTSTPLFRWSHLVPCGHKLLQVCSHHPRCCATKRRCSQTKPCSLLQSLQGIAPTAVRGRRTLASPKRCGWAQTQAGATGGAGPSFWPAGSTPTCW